MWADMVNAVRLFVVGKKRKTGIKNYFQTN